MCPRTFLACHPLNSTRRTVVLHSVFIVNRKIAASMWKQPCQNRPYCDDFIAILLTCGDVGTILRDNIKGLHVNKSGERDIMPGKRGTTASELKRKRAVQLYNEGYSLTEVANMLNRSRSFVKQCWKKRFWPSMKDRKRKRKMRKFNSPAKRFITNFV